MSGTDAPDHESYRTNLAHEEMRLARERTILAHIRTGFASFLFGIAIYGLFGDLLTNIVGGVFVTVGVVFLVTGWLSYAQSNRRARRLLDEFEQSLRRY